MSETKLKRLRYCCSAFACEHFGYYNTCESFHNLPRDPDLRQKWIEILKIPEEFVLNSATCKSIRVCNNHFKDEDYKGYENRRILEPNSVPSLLLEKDPETASFVPPPSVKVSHKRKSFDADISSESYKSENEEGKDVKEGEEVKEVEQVKDVEKVKEIEKVKEEEKVKEVEKVKVEKVKEVVKVVEKVKEVKEEVVEVRSRPKRRAAKVAEKKMIEAASSVIDDMIKDEEEEKETSFNPKQTVVIPPPAPKRIQTPIIRQLLPFKSNVITLTPTQTPSPSPKQKIESEMVIKTPGKSILNSLLPSSISITPITSKSPSNTPQLQKPMSNRTARKSFVCTPNSSTPKASMSVKQSTSISKYTQGDQTLELDMQCDEEPLSIPQISAYNKSMMEYQLAVSKLKKLRSENHMIRYEYEPAEAPQRMNMQSQIEASATPMRQSIKIGSATLTKIPINPT